MTRRVVRWPEYWREVDRRVRIAVALHSDLSTTYEHTPLCECPVCRGCSDRIGAIIERIEAEVRQDMICEGM